MAFAEQLLLRSIIDIGLNLVYEQDLTFVFSLAWLILPAW